MQAKVRVAKAQKPRWRYDSVQPLRVVMVLIVLRIATGGIIWVFEKVATGL
jgi:hypothetical protein